MQMRMTPSAASDSPVALSGSKAYLPTRKKRGAAARSGLTAPRGVPRGGQGQAKITRQRFAHMSPDAPSHPVVQEPLSNLVVAGFEIRTQLFE